MNEPHHDKIELPEHDCLYESTNEQGYIDLEPAYRKSTVLRLLEADRKRIAELESANAELERLCDETYVAQGANAYNLACEEMEDWQAERRKAGKEVGTTGSLCDGIQWLYGYIEELEAKRRDISNECEPVDKGPWKAGVNRNDKRTFIESDDFTHDVRLYVDGDFADQDEKLAYALGIVDQLNAAPQPAEPEGYVHTIPDDCETLHWRGQILSLNELAAISAEPVSKTDWNSELSSWSDEDFIRIFHERPDLANRLRKMLAETVKRKRPYAQGTALGEYGVIPMCDQVDDEPVVPHPAESIVSDVEAIVRLLESREWAEHVATTPLGQRLETAVTALVDADQRPSETVKGVIYGPNGFIATTTNPDPVKVLSDAEIGQILKEVLHNSCYGVHQWELWLEFASALFTRCTYAAH